jgi:hypothetical protein
MHDIKYLLTLFEFGRLSRERNKWVSDHTWCSAQLPLDGGREREEDGRRAWVCSRDERNLGVLSGRTRRREQRFLWVLTREEAIGRTRSAEILCLENTIVWWFDPARRIDLLHALCSEVYFWISEIETTASEVQ